MSYLSHSISKFTIGLPSSGELKFSQLRSTFKKTSSGTVSASELLRITDLSLSDPIVPDCKENEDLGIPAAYLPDREGDPIVPYDDKSWKISQMRSVTIRYEVTNDIPNEDIIGHHITLWNDNLERNIPKIYWIDNAITASRNIIPALQFRRDELSNLTIEFGSLGSVKGAFGPGGGTWENDYGGDGGDALWFEAKDGYNNKIKIPNRNTIVLAGGGGGGGKGGQGTNGPGGVKWFPRVNGETSNYDTTKPPNHNWGEWYSYRKGSGNKCDSTKGKSKSAREDPNGYINDNRCYSDPSLESSVDRDIDFDGTKYHTRVYSSGQINSGFYQSSKELDGECDRHCRDKIKVGITWYRGDCGPHGHTRGPGYCAVEDPAIREGAPGGEGGNGGNGTGTTDGMIIVSQTNGELAPAVGEPGGPENTANNDEYGSDGNVGETGGDGGGWGQPGLAGGTDPSFSENLTFELIGVYYDDNNYILKDVQFSSYTFYVDGQIVDPNLSSNSSVLRVDDKQYSAVDLMESTGTTGTVGVQFNASGDLVVTGTGTKDIQLHFGWFDNQGRRGMAVGQYIIPDLGVKFTQGILDEPSWDYPQGRLIAWQNGHVNQYGYEDGSSRIEGGEVNEKAPWTQIVTVTGGTTYEAQLIKPQEIIGRNGIDPINISPGRHNNRGADWTFRANNNQRFLFKDNDDQDGNAAVWISEVNETLGQADTHGWYGLDDDGTGIGVIRGTTADDSSYNSTLPAVGEESEVSLQKFSVKVEQIFGLGEGSGGGDGFPGGKAGRAIGGRYPTAAIGKGVGYVVEGFANDYTMRGFYNPLPSNVT